ncbi:MAG: glutathione S-transferase family protein [Candidatus Obscuribacterales bacterium]|nr:glutathione S-transferase family protein [Steroidobacteraceae bacterium]
MILIGMFDSPFVRRVAVSMQLLGVAFEHRNWSVGKDFELIRQHNPLGQVPTLVLNDGEALSESSAILDHIDQTVGMSRALLPQSGAARRQALQVMALAVGAAEKGRAEIYERVFRPADKWHQPWVDRCRLQMHAALAELNHHCAKRGSDPWLVGDGLTQADITVTCAFTFLSEAQLLTFASDSYHSLRKLVERCEALPEFKSTYVAWSAPATGT